MQIQPVEFSIFCDYASMSVDGKINLNGVFDRIAYQKLPVIHPQMFIVSKLLLPKGEHKISFTLMQEDAVIAKASLEKNLTQNLSNHHHVWSISGLKLEKDTPLELQILLGGQQIFIKRLPLIKLDPPEKTPEKGHSKKDA